MVCLSTLVYWNFMSVEWQQELDQEWKWCHFFRGFDLSVWMLYLKFPEIQIFKPCAKLAAFIQVCTIILKRSWILVIILKCSWIHLRSLKSTGFLCQVLKSPQNSKPCLHHTVFCETEDITWLRGDTKFLFDCWKIFHEWAQQTSEIFFQHEKRNFVSPRCHVMFYFII